MSGIPSGFTGQRSGSLRGSLSGTIGIGHIGVQVLHRIVNQRHSDVQQVAVVVSSCLRAYSTRSALGRIVHTGVGPAITGRHRVGKDVSNADHAEGISRDPSVRQVVDWSILRPAVDDLRGSVQIVVVRGSVVGLRLGQVTSIHHVVQQSSAIIVT